jgi:hypothetical protein
MALSNDPAHQLRAIVPGPAQPYAHYPRDEVGARQGAGSVAPVSCMRGLAGCPRLSNGLAQALDEIPRFDPVLECYPRVLPLVNGGNQECRPNEPDPPRTTRHKHYDPEGSEDSGPKSPVSAVSHRRYDLTVAVRSSPHTPVNDDRRVYLPIGAVGEAELLLPNLDA